MEKWVLGWIWRVGAQGWESATWQQGLLMGYQYGAGNGEVSECPLPHQALPYSPYFRPSPCFCSSVGNTAERGLQLRDAAVCSARGHRLVLLRTHGACLGTAGTERGDQGFSCSKKMVDSYMGTTGTHGGHCTPSSTSLVSTCTRRYPQVAVTRGQGLAGPGCPQKLQPGCSLPQFLHRRDENPVILQLVLCTVFSR